jgi:signal transduction histidine kinase
VENGRDNLVRIKEIILANFNATIDMVSTPNDAMLLIDYYSFDIILNEVSGFVNTDLTEYISKSFLNSNTPIVYVTEVENIKALMLKKLHPKIVDIVSNSMEEEEIISVMNLYFRFITRERRLLKDITKRRDYAEDELKKYKEYFRNIVGKTTAGILIIDQKGIIQFVNEAAEQIFMRNRSELLNTPFGVIIGNQIKTEIDIVRKNGDVGVGEITTAKTEWKGKPAKLVLINDITDHKRLLESLEYAKLKAQESDMLKTAFLANMSHEIRTPLNGILGFSQLLYQNDLGQEKKKSYIESITSCGNHLLSIVNDIIDIAQIEAGQLTLAESEFDLIKIMEEIYGIFRINKKIVTNNIELKLTLPTKQSIPIRSDKARLKQILFNILNNAVKFTDTGSITFGLEIEKQGMLKFYVKDTGIGIPEIEFQHIFERFRQVELPKERLNEGNGLGLSISKALVNLLGGEIWLESELGKGTVFYFTIKANILENAESSGKENSSLSKKPLFANKKILVVEDEETNFDFIQSLLDACQTTIFWAKNGEEAIEIAKKEDIDIILMDMKLPIKSGYDAVKEIRMLKPDIPIIAQTAYAMAGDKEKILNAGCNDYISKPIKVRDLILKMHHYLN